ncbi:MAG TPA: hypothetical protein VFY04_05390 [Solirubrobacterales bacterium]|nr:hypothetical protein [Solirubrobacterales bacterium]
MRRLIAALCASAVVLSWISPASATARTEGGNPCAANATLADSTAIGLTNPPSQFMQPTIWGDVITRWMVQAGPGIGPVAQRLEVFEQTFAGEDERYRKIGESALETVVAGPNEFPTRIPMTGEGPRFLGLRGPVETLICEELPGALSGVAPGEFAAGEAKAVEIESNMGTPVTVIAEPDRDQDGYGDETQDRCERSAATQGECPTVTLSAARSTVTRGAILLPLAVTSEGWVEVRGEVSWKLPRRRAAKGGSKASKRVGRRIVVALKATEARTVLPGEVATFRVPLPKSVRRRLAALPRGRALRAKLVATAEDLAYRETTTAVSVKLAGRSSPAGTLPG